MTKTELIEQVAERADLTRADAQRAVDAALASVQDALKRGSDVTLPGFGKFSISKRAARTGRNPATGETIKIKASKSVRFSAGATLKKAVA
jgi:DNA-binding protein HU-beta